jgi:hypothetical protein
LPSFVVSEVLGHVVKIFLFFGQRRFKDAFGLARWISVRRASFITRSFQGAGWFLASSALPATAFK